jgi:nucleotide-binding universal stress UspA family protein
MGRIVVGVDGSATATAALRWAVHEARLRDATVEAWHAWHVPFAPGSGMPPDEHAVEQAARRTLDDAVAAAGGEIERFVVRGVAASALLDAARDADLLVVGAHGAEGHEGVLLGSVSQQVVAHAPCPVVVVPAHR